MKTKQKDSVVESVFCGGLLEFDIAGTGAVYIKESGGALCFSPPTLGLTIRVEGRRKRFTSRDQKGCKEECSSGGQVLIVFRSLVPLGAAATPAGAAGATVLWHHMSYLRSPAFTPFCDI